MEEVIANEDFIERLSHLKNFCPHFHLSLQSGSASVLKRMNRRYTPDEFAATCQLIRKYFPSASITTDVIVGFPNETDEEFEQTYEFIKKINFSGLHIFPYSHRSGTVASREKDLPAQIKKVRAEKLASLDKVLRSNFVKQNKRGEVLIEKCEDGKCEGFTKNYIMCHFDQEGKVGQIVEAEIIGEINGEAKAKII